MKKVLVTGASGFIGHSLCKALLKSGMAVCGTVRTLNSRLSSDEIEFLPIGDISLKTDWKDVLVGIDCIIHCAAKVHERKDTLQLYKLVNTESTKQLAKQAAELGVRRLIFLSSIGVNGLDTHDSSFFLHSDTPNPIENYAISKYEAEQELIKVSNDTGLEVVIIRPPLVYGQSAPGNLNRLVKLINLGIPLPFDGIKNKRSFIGLDNLINLLSLCIDHPKANGKTFLVSDGKDLSTPELIRLIASSMKKKSYLFSLPIFILKFMGFVFGKKKEINKLVGSLRIDNSYTKEILNWTPPMSIEEGIRKMAKGK